MKKNTEILNQKVIFPPLCFEGDERATWDLRKKVEDKIFSVDNTKDNVLELFPFLGLRQRMYPSSILLKE